MLDFIQKVHGCNYLDLATCLPAPMLDNVEVAQALCRASVEFTDSGFQYFSERVRVNREIVLEMVRSNGKIFQFVDDDALRGDEEIVKAACASYAAALLRCNNAALLKQLVNDKALVEELFDSEGYEGSISHVAERCFTECPLLLNNPTFWKLLLENSRDYFEMNAILRELSQNLRRTISKVIEK